MAHPTAALPRSFRPSPGPWLTAVTPHDFAHTWEWPGTSSAAPRRRDRNAFSAAIITRKTNTAKHASGQVMRMQMASAALWPEDRLNALMPGNRSEARIS